MFKVNRDHPKPGGQLHGSGKLRRQAVGKPLLHDSGRLHRRAVFSFTTVKSILQLTINNFVNTGVTIMIVTIGNTKGGVGKSVVSAHLAVAALNRGLQVILIDADPQGSSMAFRAMRETDDLPAVAITTPTVHKDVERFGDYGLVIIDAGGRDGKAFRSAVAAADLLIIPILPSPYDVWATEDTIEVLREIRVYKDLPAVVLFNQTRDTVMNKDTRAALDEYAEDVRPMNACLRYHEFYKKAIAAGKGVSEYRPGSPPSCDINAVLDEILKHGKSKK